MRYLFILFLWIASAGAEVIVYKGTARARLDSAKQISKIPRCYFIVDIAARTGYIISYYKLNGVKNSMPIGLFNNARYLGESISDVTRIGTFTAVVDNDFGAEFGRTMLYLRGKEKSLTLANTGVPTLGNFPKTLGGILRGSQLNGALATNFEVDFTLAFDAIHTQTANNGFKSGLATATEISAELDALGY